MQTFLSGAPTPVQARSGVLGAGPVRADSEERLLHQVKRCDGTVDAQGLSWLRDRGCDDPLPRLRTQIGVPVGRQPLADVDELVFVAAMNARPPEHGE